jgi:hypothetical protein
LAKQPKIWMAKAQFHRLNQHWSSCTGLAVIVPAARSLVMIDPTTNGPAARGLQLSLSQLLGAW